MRMDLIKVADIVIEKIKREYPDDVAIMCLCGSYVYGDTHEKSDLDFYFIPKTPRGFEMFHDFIIGDIGFDLWPLPWEGVESFAGYNDRRVSIIADGQVVYFASNEDLTRFQRLQQIAQNPEGIDFDAKVQMLVRDTEAAYFAIIENSRDFSLARQNAVQLLFLAVDPVATANRTYIKRGWGKAVAEIQAMPNVPVDFKALYNGVLFAKNTAALTEKALALVKSVKQTVLPPKNNPVNFKDALKMFYEEEKSCYNKIYHACDTGNAVTAALAGASLQQEICNIMGVEGYRRAGFNDIVAGFSQNDLPEYKKAVTKHEKQFTAFLAANGVNITWYADIDEFKKAMEKSGK